ncbi:MAG: hypothetical protein GY867_03390 [bacterium]|nr:hypothetical protein [bacterium]
MKDEQRLYTVLVGDLVGSSRLAHRQNLAEKIDSALKHISVVYLKDFRAPPVLTRGMDELSGVLHHPKHSFEICLRLNEEVFPLKFRFAVAEGSLDVGLKSGDARRMDGEAFHRAAVLMEMLKKKDTKSRYGFHLAPPHEEFGALLYDLTSLFSVITDRRTQKQVDTIRLYRRLRNQNRVAAELGITQQAVSDALRATHWKELHRVEKAIADVLDRRGVER